MAGFKSLRRMSNGGFRFSDDNIGEVAGEWIGTYVDYEPLDSPDVFRYKWAKIKGNKGDVGDYYEYRYAKNGSTTTPPAIDTSVLVPDGWSTQQPSVGELEYLWTTMAKISGDGQTLLQKWSTPVRFTPKDGADGKQGESPALVFRGEYDTTGATNYYGNKYRVDAVKYNGSYYVARIDAGTFAALPTDTSKWNPFGASFESVATNLLLAENANVAGFVFKNNKLISQTNNSDGTPMLELDGVNGKISIRDGLFYGSIAEKPKELENTSNLALDLSTGFNFAGYTTSNRTITLPTDTKYNGVRCSIINTRNNGGYFIIKCGNSSAFMYSCNNSTKLNITSIKLYGIGELRLRAVSDSDNVLKWFIENDLNFSYDWANTCLTNGTSSPVPRLIDVFQLAGNSLTSLFCADNNKPYISSYDKNGQWWTIKFTKSRAGHAKKYLVLPIGKMPFYPYYIRNKNDAGFEVGFSNTGFLAFSDTDGYADVYIFEYD